MKKTILAILAGLVAVSGLVFGYSGRQNALGSQVTYYAKVKTISTSGSTAFYYYDMQNGQVECDREDNWFWGVPRQMEDDQKVLNYVQFLGDREDYIFRITGVREEDDCEYLEGKCLESLILDKVEAVQEPA